MKACCKAAAAFRAAFLRATASLWSPKPPPLPQLSEADIRIELCRALLRVGQYRLCKSYLAGLRPEAAEQLVLAAAREVFLSASGMADRAVKQASGEDADAGEH